MPALAFRSVPPIIRTDGAVIGFVRPFLARCPGCERPTTQPVACDKRLCVLRHLGGAQHRHGDAA